MIAEPEAILFGDHADPVCVLCVGEPDGCPRCGGSGTDPDPLAPVLDEAS